MSTLGSELEQRRRRLSQLLCELAPVRGRHPSVLPGVTLLRTGTDHAEGPELCEPAIFILASGRHKGHADGGPIFHDAERYLILGMPRSFASQLEPGLSGDPALAISIRVDLRILSEVAMQLNLRPGDPANGSHLQAAAVRIEAGLMDSAIRLLEYLRSVSDALVLGPSAVREIFYRALSGPHGHILLALLARNGQLTQVLNALQKIHEHYSEPLDVPRMASEAGMSISAFHHTFKTVMSTSPLRYLKKTRLEKARMLMVYDGIGAQSAAALVGYASASQFTREFKRHFGLVPTEEVLRLRAMLNGSILQSSGAA
jgi:AraC-like DNA-binding protein